MAIFIYFSRAQRYNEYAPIIEEAYGGYPTMELLITDENAYETYLKLAEELPPPAINSVPVYRFEEGDLREMNKGFRFMGQRFTIDAAIMQQLVFRNVEGTNKEGGYRMLPDTLDVPAVLGSDVAFEILEAQGETEYGGYTENMEQLRSMLRDAPQSSWTTSLYSSWLYTLLPLLEEKGEGYPSYMTSTQWAKKSLETFAGRVAAVIQRLDDVEDKWVVVPDGLEITAGQVEELTCFQEQYFRTRIITGQ